MAIRRVTLQHHNVGQVAEVVTPSDTVDLVNAAKFLYIGVAGNVTIIDAAGNTIPFLNHPIGYLWCAATRVKATGTAADSIVAIS